MLTPNQLLKTLGAAEKAALIEALREGRSEGAPERWVRLRLPGGAIVTTTDQAALNNMKMRVCWEVVLALTRKDARDSQALRPTCTSTKRDRLETIGASIAFLQAQYDKIWLDFGRLKRGSLWVCLEIRERGGIWCCW